MPNSSCSDTPGRISPRLPRPQASFRPAISLESSRPGRAFHPPTGAERSTEIDRFRNPRPAPDSPVFPPKTIFFCSNNNFSCLNDKISRQDFSVCFFLLILFSNSSVRSHAFLREKIPRCPFALRMRKSNTRPGPQKFPPPQKKSQLTPPRHLRCARITPIRAGGVLFPSQSEQIFEYHE